MTDFGGLTPITRRNIRQTPAVRPLAVDLEDVASLHLAVKAAVYKALAEGPAETVADRIDFDSFRDLGHRTVDYLNAAEARVAAARTQCDQTIDTISSAATRRAKQVGAASIGAGFDPRGFFVYVLLEDERPIYVGMSSNILARLGSHMENPDRRSRITRVAIIRCASEETALATERDLIAQYQPELNVRGVGLREVV